MHDTNRRVAIGGYSGVSLRCCMAAVALLAAGAAGAQATLPRSFDLMPDPLRLEFIPNSRTDNFAGSKIRDYPLVDPTKGTTNVGFSLYMNAGGPAIEFVPPNGLRPPTSPPSIAFNGSIRLPGVPDVTFASGTVAATASVNGTSWGLQTGVFHTEGYSSAVPAGWGSAMRAWNEHLAGDGVAARVQMTVTRANTSFNQFGVGLNVGVQQAQIFFKPEVLRNADKDSTGRSLDRIFISVGAKTSDGTPLPILDVARSMGFDHFNFVNKITDIRYAPGQKPDVNCVGFTVSLPTVDPPLCGWGSGVSAVGGDRHPYYYDVTSIGSELVIDGTPYVTVGKDGVAGGGDRVAYGKFVADGNGGFDLKGVSPGETATAVVFSDMPAERDVSFETWLVGVRQVPCGAGTYGPWFGPCSEAVPVGDKVFEWYSNYGLIKAERERPFDVAPNGAPSGGDAVFSNILPIGDLDGAVPIDLSPISFADYAKREGAAPMATLAAYQTSPVPEAPAGLMGLIGWTLLAFRAGRAGTLRSTDSARRCRS